MRSRREGLSILVIDKDLDALCQPADRHYVLEKGEVVWSAATSDLRADPRIHETYLGV